jgi:multidrug resistance efflux pump
VKIVFEPDQPGVDRLEPGMSAEVKVDTRNASAAGIAEAR